MSTFDQVSWNDRDEDCFNSNEMSNKSNLPGIKFLGTEPKLRIRKKNSLWCVNVLYNTSRERISRSSRAVMAKKCSKKCVVRAEW